MKERKIKLPVSMRMEDSGNLNLLTSKYFIHFASLMHPLSSCRDRLYDTAHTTARFRPCADGAAAARGWTAKARGKRRMMGIAAAEEK